MTSAPSKEAELLALAERLRERITGFTSMLGERMWTPSRSHIQTDMKLMQDVAEMLVRLAAAPCPGREGPVGWVVFAENGNVRLWGIDRAGPEAFASARGLKCEPVYTSPVLGMAGARAHDDYAAWLVEINEPVSGPLYYRLKDDNDWTIDQDAALHFARKEDAQKIIDYYGWTRANPVEHMWCEKRPPPSSASQDSPTRPDGLGDELERELCGDELNGGLIRDLCFTVWSICHNPSHADGNSDWGSDTFPTVQKAVGIVRSKLKAALSAKPEPAAVGEVREASREEIARIIDPTAWKMEDGYLVEQEHSDDALAKADAILALSSLPAGSGEEIAVNAIRKYLATFDRCGGSETVSAEDFAECRATMRAVLARSFPPSPRNVTDSEALSTGTEFRDTRQQEN